MKPKETRMKFGVAHGNAPATRTLEIMRAAEDALYQDLGLVDAAIGAVARANGCAVLTDDLGLYLRLSHDKVPVFNFTHLLAEAGQL